MIILRNVHSKKKVPWLLIALFLCAVVMVL